VQLLTSPWAQSRMCRGLEDLHCLLLLLLLWNQSLL
jgi:hypothetical protein